MLPSVSLALVIGVAILVAWPLFNIALAGYATVATRRMVRQARDTSRLAPPEAAAGKPAHQFWIVIPCLNEQQVIERTVRAALAQRAAGVQSQVLVVDDGSDDATPQVLRNINDSRLHVLRRELPEARRGKGEALNAAYQLICDWVAAAGDDPARHVIGIIDGDGRGSSNMLADVAGLLQDPTVGAVQCRVRIHNRNRLLGMVQDIEFGSVADANQVVRDTFGSVGLGGNGQFVRMSALLKLGEAPWSACLVEDLELGLRLHLAGVQVRYCPTAAVHQQGLVTLGRLLRQRTRWAQGNLQCIRYLRELFLARGIRNHTFVEMSYYLLAPWFNAAGVVLILGFWTFAASRLTTGTSLSVTAVVIAVVFAGWLSVLMLPGLLWGTLHRLRLGDESWWRCLRGGVAYPFLLMVSLISTWRALGRHLSRRRGWAKTERLPEPVTLREVTR